MAGMEIDIASGSLDKLEQKLEKVAGVLDRIDATTGSIKTNANGIRTGSGGGGGARTQAADRFTSGPNQRIIRLQEERERAQNISDPARRGAVLRDIEQGLFRARRSHIINERRIGQGDSASSAPGLLDYFQTLNGLLSARDPLSAARHIGRGIQMVEGMGAGGLNIQQKLAGMRAGINLRGAGGAGAAAVGGAEGLAGAAGGAGPLIGGALAVGAALLIAAKGAEVFAREMNESVDRLSAHAATATLGGGFMASAQLRALGLSSGEISGSGSLHERLASDGFARFTAGQMGLGNVIPSRFGGPQDDARLMHDVLVNLRRETDPNEQLRKARILGVEGQLDKIRVSDRVFNQAERVGAQGGEIDARFGGAARDLDRQKELFGQQFEQLKDQAFGPLLRASELELGGFNRLVAGWVKVNNLIEDGMAHIPGIGGLFGDSHQTAQQAQTTATYDLVDAIQKLATQFNRAYGAGTFGDAGMSKAARGNPFSEQSYRENSPYWEWLG